MSSVGSFGFGGGGSSTPGSAIKSISETVTLAAGNTTHSSVANLLPAKSFIMGVQGLVVTSLGAQTWSLGVLGDTTRFAAVGRAAAIGTETDSLDPVSSGLAGPQSPYANGTAAKAIITSNAPMAAQATIKVTVYYYEMP